MRVALLGKGGVGKTVIAATLARLLARSGRRVVAADLDPSSGLDICLGLGSTDGGLPREALEEDPAADYGWRLATTLTPGEVVERFSIPAPDGVRHLSVGRLIVADRQRARRSVAAVRQVLRGLRDSGWDVVGDLPAGTTSAYEGYHDFADRVCLVMGPGWRSALTVRRLLPLVQGREPLVVRNQVADGVGHHAIASAVEIPLDPAVADAARAGVALIDLDESSPAVHAIAALADLLAST